MVNGPVNTKKSVMVRLVEIEYCLFCKADEVTLSTRHMTIMTDANFDDQDFVAAVVTIRQKEAEVAINVETKKEI